MAPQRGSRGRGRRGSGSGTSAFPSPSPLVRNSNACAPTHPSGSSTPCTPFTVELDDDSPSTKKRRWTSSVWKHYNIKEGKHFPDAKDRAYCKYCNGGPIDADSSNDNPQANVSGARRGKDDLVVCSLNLIYVVYVFFINKSYLICLYVLICVFDLCRDLQILIVSWYLRAEFQN
ncbi:hypothetical protein Cgig2_002025 [Carnegiea gigantea]|uniref:Uncharacterized protein n=1 Tax=Carnegiea gigantea TaxID=171969 RepID=A0A9Q1GQK9_9CARY|nr:hypothetical protein Cgig2_002025 [Carnegiea gigantea]